MTNLQEKRIKYCVLVDGKVLNESFTTTLANEFIMSLTEDMKAKAVVVTIMEDGRQILYS